MSDATGPKDSFGGFEIVVSPTLAGSKLALRYSGSSRVYVSPAMFDLMKYANPQELETLLANIRVLSLPDPKLVFCGSLLSAPAMPPPRINVPFVYKEKT